MSNVMYRLEKQDRDQAAAVMKFLIVGLFVAIMAMNWEFFQNSVFPFIGEAYMSVVKIVSERVTEIFTNAFIK